MIIHRRCLLPPCCGIDTIPEECEETDPAQSVGVNEDLTCNTEKAPLEGDIVNCFDNTGINYQGEHSDPGCIDWKEAENVYFKPEFYPELKSNFCRNPGKKAIATPHNQPESFNILLTKVMFEMLHGALLMLTVLKRGNIVRFLIVNPQFLLVFWL